MNDQKIPASSRSKIHPNGRELGLEENQNPIPSEQSTHPTLFTRANLLIAFFWLDTVGGWDMAGTSDKCHAWRLIFLEG